MPISVSRPIAFFGFFFSWRTIQFIPARSIAIFRYFSGCKESNDKDIDLSAMVRGEGVGRQRVAAIRDSNCHFTLILIHTMKHAARHWSPHQQDQKNTRWSSWAYLSCRQIDCAHEIWINDKRHINQPVRLAGCFRPKISLLGVLQGVSVSLIWWHEYQKPAKEMDFRNDTGTGSMPNKLLQHDRKGWGAHWRGQEGHNLQEDRRKDTEYEANTAVWPQFQSILVIWAL